MNPPEAPPLPDLSGRLALITGGGRGIGRAIATELAAAGAAVAVVARNPKELAGTVSEIEFNGCAAMAFACDLTDVDSLKALNCEVEEGLGPIDILINNAGIVSPLGPTETVDVAMVEQSLRVNVVAPLVLSAAVLRGMRHRRWGRIVNVSSVVAAHPRSMVGGNAYTFAKAAVEAHTLNLAAELLGSGVTANVYRPGRVDTSMQAWIRAQDAELVGGGLVERFRSFRDTGDLITPVHSARSLVTRLDGDDTGCVWDVADDRGHPSADEWEVRARTQRSSSGAAWAKQFPAALPEWLSR